MTDLEQEVAILKQKVALIEKEWKQMLEVLKHLTAMLELLDLEGGDDDYHPVPIPPEGLNYFS